MLLFLTFLQDRLRSDDRGATAVEYGLLIAGIAALVVVAMVTFGPAVAAAFSDLTPSL